MERKDCQYIDFNIDIIYEPVDCEPLNSCSCITSRPRNLQLITHDAPHRLVLTKPVFVHMMPTDLQVDPKCVKVDIQRTLMCAAGCRENYFSVPVCWCGSGMLLAPGEYTFGIPQQPAWGFPLHTDLCGDNNGGVITLLLEPATEAEIQAGMYNALFRSC